MKAWWLCPIALSSAPLAAEAALDPSSIQLPDLSPRDKKVVRDGWKYFYFHKAGVSYEQAAADFRDCYRFLPVGALNGQLPMHAPWHKEAVGRAQQATNSYGLVGAAIGAMVAGPIERRARQSRMRRCLEPRGYQRYPVSEESWKQLIDGYSERSIALQAKAASGPRPDAQPVTK